MTKEILDFIKKCIEDNNLHAFYTWSGWLSCRTKILEGDKNECQKCKSKGVYTRATMVHHVKRIRKFPDLALSKYYVDEDGKKKRQLISLCDQCHDEEHPERLRGRMKKKPLTAERW
jgi:5-methylcytosine-specific restriction protein A